MTNFVKDNFIISGDYVSYPHEGENHFIARFKHDRSDKKNFIKFLIANFTVEEYLEEAKDWKKGPLTILNNKGYVSNNQKKAAAYRNAATLIEV